MFSKSNRDGFILKGLIHDNLLQVDLFWKGVPFWSELQMSLLLEAPLVKGFLLYQLFQLSKESGGDAIMQAYLFFIIYY